MKKLRFRCVVVSWFSHGHRLVALLPAKSQKTAHTAFCRHGLRDLLLLLSAVQSCIIELSDAIFELWCLFSQFLQLLDLWAAGSWLGLVGIIRCCSCCVVIYLQVGVGDLHTIGYEFVESYVEVGLTKPHTPTRPNSI